MTTSTRTLVALACSALAIGAATGDSATEAPDAVALLARSRAAYAALRSYADTGTVAVELRLPNTPALVERFSFRTAFRRPRHFSLDFVGETPADPERLVIWCDGGDFQSWWSATGVHEVWSGGRGVSAFATAAYPTRGVAAQLPPLLFPQAEMHGPLTDLTAGRIEGLEAVDGQPSHKLTARTGGHFGASRPLTVWIDAQTLLVRRIVEDTPDGTPAGTVDRVTTTFAPQANPALADARFAFTVPTSRH